MNTRIMNTRIALAGLIIALLPITAFAAPAKSKAVPSAAKSGAAKPAVMYECSKWHMKYTAAQAKKDHYKDPMDGGKLNPVKPSSSPNKPMGGMKM